MILSYETLKELCETINLVEPFNQNQLQPASYDVRLGLVRRDGTDYESIAIMPGEALLASTLEVVNVPAWLVGRLEGKSSIAREHIAIHCAGFVDPGFSGQLTLEMVNNSKYAFALKRGMRIGQIAFDQLDRITEHPYGSDGLNSHYLGQMGPTPAAH